MDLTLIAKYGSRFVDGTVITLKLLVLSSMAGAMLAIPVALARVSKRRWLWMPAYGYIYFFRGTPLLIQLFIVYYGLGQFESIRNSPAWLVLGSAQWCGFIAMSLNTSAYTAEILRGGIMGVPHGEVEAARACGMSYSMMMRRIILPRAIRIAWPAYCNEVILLLKGSALVSTISVWDLMGEARSVFARTYSLDVFVYAGIVYFLMTFMLTRVFQFSERHLNRYLMPGR
jgi:polar amino acid transport system permease protein